MAVGSMASSELELFRGAVQRAAVAGGGEKLDAALVELGWVDALGQHRAEAVSVLFETLGLTLATSSALDWLLVSALPGASSAGAGLNPVVLPMLGSWAAPARIHEGRWVVRGLGSGALERGDDVVVVAEGGDDGHVAFRVARQALDLRPVDGLDPALGVVEVSGSLDMPSSDAGWSVDWPHAVALGHLALGYELVGAGRTMLELARQHAMSRVQFGRPIGHFQAIRHRLAEALVALEAAASLLDAGWDDPDPSPVAAAMAKAFAGRAARAVARHCQQVLAGIGFTTEHALHRSVRRVLVLDQLLGAGTALTRDLGVEALRTGTLPVAAPL